MTTITIKNGLKKNNYSYSNPLEAIEEMLAEMEVVLLRPIENADILKRVKKHQLDNKNRSIDTYDNI